jgi:hypothetical protein
MFKKKKSDKRAPDFILYSVREYEEAGEQKSQFTRVGAAWSHGDDKGATVLFDRLVMRLYEPKKAEGEA